MTRISRAVKRGTSIALVTIALLAPMTAMAQQQEDPAIAQAIKFFDYALCAISLATVTPGTAWVAVLSCGKVVALYWDK